MNFTSAASLISLLDEPKTELKIFALQQLNNIVDEFWFEISDVIEKLEILYEDKSFEKYKLAGLLVSKIYFHLGSLEDSFTYALNAEELFDINFRTEYVETILGKCMDCYIEQRCAIFNRGSVEEPIHSQLESLIDRLFERCFDDEQYQHALGLAVDSRRLDIVSLAITSSENIPDMLTYAFQVTMNFIQEKTFKHQVLHLLLDFYLDLTEPDYFKICHCLIFLGHIVALTVLLFELLHGNEEDELRSYQIALDLCESATQEDLNLITEGLWSSALLPLDKKTFSEAQMKLCVQITKLQLILSGNVSTKLYSQFLIRYNKTDKLILNKTKEYLRSTVCFTGIIIANGFMCSGTTDDEFLRKHPGWLAMTTCWTQTIGIASLGVIFRGYKAHSLKLLYNYLPRDYNNYASNYTKSGFLYALGLIHANNSGKVINLILTQLKAARTKVERHGGCLGLGLVAMGTNKTDLYEHLKLELYRNDASVGEAAGIAMGMIKIGTSDELAIDELLSYAEESKHEKILRGLSVGIALIMYGRLQEADNLIEEFLARDNAVLRRSAMHTMAMAYCGTGNTEILRKCLRAAVSDSDNDVRRAAVIGIGFILFKTPEECINIVSVFTKNYNPHVRYGAAMALGIACAGTGMIEALTLLESMIKSDREHLVLQGALIASAMILMQQNEETCSKVKYFRTTYASIISTRYQSEIVKFGAILAQGIIDAGGRNVIMSLQTRTGHTNMLAVVGTLLFTQYWYWFPLAHCLSLAFTPTCLISLTSDLRMPKMKYKSNAKSSLFAYYPPLEENLEEKKTKVKVAILSKSKQKEKKSKIVNQKMNVDENKKEENATKKLNPTFEMLYNPIPVLKKHLPFVSIDEDTRFVPIKDISFGGIIMIRDLIPSKIKVFVGDIPPYGKRFVTTLVSTKAESEPPEPFEFLED